MSNFDHSIKHLSGVAGQTVNEIRKHLSMIAQCTKNIGWNQSVVNGTWIWLSQTKVSDSFVWYIDMQLIRLGMHTQMHLIDAVWLPLF